MKTIVRLFASALLLSGVFGSVHAQTNSSQTFEERQRDALRETKIHEKELSDLMREFVMSRGQNWITNYYGKTLSSLGEIDTIRITDHLTRSTPNWTHRDLWQIIEESKMQDYPKEGSTFFGVPPSFTIEYVGGLKVKADRNDVLVILPDGRKCSAYLKP